MNYSTMAFLADDKVRAISCVFKPKDILKEEQQHYTYKTTDDTIKVGDLVIVQGGNDRSKGFGFNIVEVVETDVEVDLHSHLNFKWVVHIVDASVLERTLENEKALIKEIKNRELASKREKFKEVLGIDKLDLPKLT